MNSGPTTRTVISLAVALAIPLIVGALGGLATASSLESWYPSLAKPSWTPPSWVFGPAWTVLYLLMGLAAWRVWRLGPADPAVRGALGLFALQLVFNLAWSVLFFGFQRIDLALMEVVVLLALILVTALRFGRLDRISGWLLAPYFLWTTFATTLNASVWWLNRG